MDEFTTNASRDLTLVELLDRVVDKGVVLSGDITISVADVDLVYIGLRVLIRNAEPQLRQKTSSDRLPESGADSDDTALHLRGE